MPGAKQHILDTLGDRRDTVLAREDRKAFALDGKYFRAIDDDGNPVSPERSAKPKEPQVLQIQPMRRDWEVVEGLDGLEPGRLTAVEVAGAGVVVCSVGGELYAYRDRCPACGTGLAGSAALDAEVLACAACRQRFDVRLAGRGLDRPELHLVPLPLLADDGRVRLAVGSGAGL